MQSNSQFHLERLLSEVTWKYSCDRHSNYYVNPLNTKMVQCFFYCFLKQWTFHYERRWANFVSQFIAKWAFMSKILINSLSRLSVTSWHFSLKSKKSDRLKEAGDHFFWSTLVFTVYSVCVSHIFFFFPEISVLFLSLCSVSPTFFATCVQPVISHYTCSYSFVCRNILIPYSRFLAIISSSFLEFLVFLFFLCTNFLTVY